MALATLIAVLATGSGFQLAPEDGAWTSYTADQQAAYAFRLVEGGDDLSARAVIRATRVRPRRYAFAEFDYLFHCGDRTASAEALRTRDADGALLDEIVIPAGRRSVDPIEISFIPLADVFAAACPGAPPATPREPVARP